MTDLQVVRQNQISIFIGEIGLMGHGGGVGCHLLHILLMVHVIDFELCFRQKYRLLSLIILLNDLQLCLKFIIKKNPPLLRLIWIVFRNRHDKIIHRIKVMRRCCLTNDIFTIRDRNGYSMAFLVRKHFRLSICRQDDRFCLCEIVTTVLLRLQRTDQVCRETHSFQQIRIRLSVIGSFDHLERLFDDLFL